MGNFDPAGTGSPRSGARRTREVRPEAREVAALLHEALAVLREASAQMGALVPRIARLADETALLALQAKRAVAVVDEGGGASRSPGAMARQPADRHRVEAMVERLRTDPELASGDPARLREALRRAIECCDLVELAYVTDLRGIQLAEVGPRGGFESTREGGRDWSQRPWFTGALRCAGPFISEVYRSAATGAGCVTISATFGPSSAAPRGVVGVDLGVARLQAAGLSP